MITRARLRNISCLIFGLTAGIVVLGETHSSSVIAGGADGSVSALAAEARGILKTIARVESTSLPQLTRVRRPATTN
jgi:hypothetical protein